MVDLTEVTRRLEAGEERDALKLFEKEVLAAKKRKDLDRLREYAPFAEALVDRVTGRQRKIAERTLYVIKQNIRLLEASSPPLPATLNVQPPETDFRQAPIPAGHQEAEPEPEPEPDKPVAASTETFTAPDSAQGASIPDLSGQGSTPLVRNREL